MKRLGKTILRILTTLVVIVVWMALTTISLTILLCILSFAFQIPSSIRFRRYCEYPTPEALIAAKPDAVKEVKIVELDGATFTMLNIGYIRGLYEFPSGAAILVYDANGRLVDKTIDVGDDWRFNQKWSRRESIPDRVCSWEELGSLEDPQRVEKRYSTRVPRHLSPLGNEVPAFDVTEQMKSCRIPSLSLKPPANLMDALLFLQVSSVPFDGSGKVILFAIRPLAEGERYPEVCEIYATDILFEDALKLITDSAKASYFIRSDGVVVIEPKSWTCENNNQTFLLQAGKWPKATEE